MLRSSSTRGSRGEKTMSRVRGAIGKRRNRKIGMSISSKAGIKPNRHSETETSRAGRGSSAAKDELISQDARTYQRPRLSTTAIANRSGPAAEEGSELRVITLHGTIPDITQWMREAMDNEVNCKTMNARAFARKVCADHSFQIVSGDTYWKGELRLWEDVYAWTSRLPSKGRANCFFEAMRRYPSSGLVYYGLKAQFGRSMAVGDVRMPRLMLSQNAIASFSPFLVGKKSLKEWFESNTHVRIQETVIHMSAMAEYVLRCAFVAKQRSDSGSLLSILNTRIKQDRDLRNRNVLRFHPWNILDDISAKNASLCLHKARGIAHAATIEGAKTACRKYGRKRIRDEQREKVKLWMLWRPLSEVMDSVVLRLESEIRDVLGIDVDIDEFRLHMTRLLRKVEGIYMDIGRLEFGKEADAKIPTDFRSSAVGLTVSSPYTFSPPRP